MHVHLFFILDLYGVSRPLSDRVARWHGLCFIQLQDNHEQKGVIIMQKYFCNPCGYTYDPEKGDPEHGIAPGTAFEDIPDDWVCPVCGVSKDMFQACIEGQELK